LSSIRRKAFVVEDESLVLINLEDMLDQMGWSIIAQAMRLADAERLAASTELPDVAILDVNLGGVQVFPVAQILASRGVPILFATGYGREGLPPEWQSYPVIAKPYTQAEVERALGEVLALHP